MNDYIFKVLCRQINAIGVFEWKQFEVTAQNEFEAKELVRNKVQYTYEYNAIEYVSSDYQGWTNSRTWAAALYLNQESIIYKKISAIRKTRKISESEIKTLWYNEKHAPCDNWTKGTINFREIADSYNGKEFI